MEKSVQPKKKRWTSVQRKTPLKRSTKPIARSPIKRSTKQGSQLRQSPLKKISDPSRKACPPKYLNDDGSAQIFPDKREICTDTPQGRALYTSRIEQMVKRQNYRCCIGGEPMTVDKADFEHETGRGMGGGHRDDRIADEDGKPINGAACRAHNSAKGSKRGGYADLV